MPRSHRLAEAHVRWVIRYRWIVLVASLVVAVVLGAGVRQLSFTNNYRVFFSAQNPQLQAFEALEHIYTKNDFLLIALQPADGEVFSRRVLGIVAELTERAWQLPYASRVDSLTNFQHTRAEGDELIVADLVPDPASLTDAQVAEIERVALAEPMLYRRVIAADGRTTGVSVRLQIHEGTRTEIGEAADAARALLADFRQRHPEVRFEVTGTVMLSTAFAEAPAHDTRLLFPLTFALLLGAMFLFLRSASGVFATFLLVLLSVGAAMGAAGWMRVPLNSASAIAPLIIMTLAIADSVHLLMTMFAEMHRGRGKEQALVECVRVNAQPIFLTTLTTVIGFLGLNTSESPPLRDLGNIAAVGIAFAWLYSMTFLLAAVAVLPTGIRPRADEPFRAMGRVADFVIARRRMLLWGGVAVILALVACIPRLQINDRPVEYFDRQNDFRRATEFTVDNLTGFYGFNFSLAAGEPGGINNPDYLERVAAFSDWLRARPEVVHVVSITDTIRRLNRNLHGDDPEQYRLPESRELAAQYLLLYEMSLPYGLDLNDMINVDKSATRMSVSCGDIDFRSLKQLKREAEAWLREHGLPSMRAEASSPAVMFAFIGERNVESMVQGTFFSFLLISSVLILTLRSLRVGALSIIPNLAPIAMGFGVWALTVGEVDFAVSIVASVSLGIIDDNTVHLLTDYLRGRREEGLSPAAAVRYALSTTGSALFANAAILVVGFGALAFSAFWPNATLGLLTSIVIALAIITDFLFLPPLLLWLDRDGSAGVRRPGPTVRAEDLRDHPSSRAAFIRIDAFKRKSKHWPVSGFLFPASCWSFLFLTSLAVAAAAESPEEKGLRLSQEADARDQGFGDWRAELTMELRNQHGEVSRRQLRMQGLENPDPDDGDKTLIVFDLPRDVKGTALLSHAHILEPDDQWLFLPALKRVKRVSSGNKSGPFMGSEFAYEDFTAQEVGKYSYQWLRDEPCGELTCWVIERHPEYERSGYTRQIVWLDQQEYRAQKVEYYDRKDQLLKVLTLRRYRRYLDKHWRALELSMENRQNGKSTLLTWSAYEFRVGLSEADFTETALQRSR